MSSPICGCDAPYLGPSVEGCGGSSIILFMSLLNNFLTTTCDISEICDRVRPLSQPNDEYEFIVIGGGSGGAAAAGRLSEHYNVLLIEAGTDEPPGSQVPSLIGSFLGPNPINWGFKTEPEPQSCISTNGCNWARGKVLGGTSVLHGMMFVRGTPADYQRWVDLGATGWSYDDLLPYFKRSENNLEFTDDYHGTDGPTIISRYPYQPELAADILVAAEELGYPVSEDLSGEQFVGFAIAQMDNINGTRQSSARAYLRPNRNNPNLNVMLNSTATRILIETNGDEKIATGVEFIYENVTYQVRATREVIVSAGAVQSPQILLLSGIGPKDVLDAVGIEQTHDLPGVGQNLHNHVSFELSYNLTNRPNDNLLNWATVVDYLTNRQGPLSSTGMSQVTARINSQYANESGQDPDIQLFFSGYSAGCAQSCSDETQPGDFRIFSIAPVNLHPNSRGNITLQSNNPLDPPLIYGGYLSDDEDIEILLDGLRIAQRVANTTVLREKYGAVPIIDDYGYCNEDFELDSDDFWRCAIRYTTAGENHQAGSCKIGSPDDQFAVVNPELQLYGIENIRVIDASVMPQVVSGNTHATIVAIAEKGVQHINDRYLQ